MPKAKAIEPTRKLTLQMPPDLMARLELYLLSPSRGQVPKGAWSKFFCERAEEFFEKLGNVKGEASEH